MTDATTDIVKDSSDMAFMADVIEASSTRRALYSCRLCV